MRMLTITNLYPRPDEPTRGLFNAQLFAAVAGKQESAGLANIVLVPEWRLWRWPAIRRWKDPCVRSLESGIRSQYVPVFHLPILGRNMAWRFHVLALRRHRALFEQCDVVLATWLYPDATAAGIVAREYGKPFWVKLHGTDRFHLDHPVRGRIVHGVVKDAAGFLPNAHFLADYLAAHGIPREKIHVARHGIDHERFHPRPKQQAWSELTQRCPSLISAFRLARRSLQSEDGFHPSSLPLVLYVGHLKQIKGPDRLIAAFSQLDRDLTLIIIGDGPMRGDLETQAQELGVADRVSFLGARSPDEVALWMNVAACLCLPSRSEGMPNVVMEALASGCPVVATDVGDVANVVTEGIAGVIVALTSEDVVTAIAAGLKRVLALEISRDAVAERAGRPSWGEVADRLIGYINGSVGDSDSSGQSVREESKEYRNGR